MIVNTHSMSEMSIESLLCCGKRAVKRHSTWPFTSSCHDYESNLYRMCTTDTHIARLVLAKHRTNSSDSEIMWFYFLKKRFNDEQNDSKEWQYHFKFHPTKWILYKTHVSSLQFHFGWFHSYHHCEICTHKRNNKFLLFKSENEHHVNWVQGQWSWKF